MRNLKQFQRLFIYLGLAAILPAQSSYALNRVAARDQGKRLYERIAGKNPSDSALKQMTDLIADGKVEAAAFVAMQDLGFYKLTIRQMVNSLTSRTFSTEVALNPNGTNVMSLSDSSALAVGLVRDNEPFDQILYGDVLYTAPDDLQNYAGISFTINNIAVTATQNNPLISPSNVNRSGLANSATTPADVAMKVRPFIDGNNNNNVYRYNLHWADLEAKYNDWPNKLVKRRQSDVWSIVDSSAVIPAEDIAGVMTTRQAASEFLIAGTNRRMFRYMVLNYLCKDMDQLSDTNVPDDMVRADVDRKPGGNSLTYLNTCKGCHAGIDGFLPAFSFLDFSPNGNNVMTRLTSANANFSFAKTVAQSAYPNFPFNMTTDNKQFRQASVYPDGFNPLKMQPNGNNWVNRWADGVNASILGWRVPAGMTTYTKGKGVNQLGRVLAATQAFSSCMTRRVFQKVCFRSPTLQEAGQLNSITSGFENGFSEYSSYSANGKYNLKAVFAKSANICFGR